MAAKRVSKSVIDWVALSEKIPAGQKEAYKTLKATCDKYITQLAEFPTDLPKINFAEYLKRIPDTALVADFEKKYGSLKVPYPKDVDNVTGKLSEEQKKALERSSTFVSMVKEQMKTLKEVVDLMNGIPAPERMTRQMYNYYFPENAINPNRENPGFFPQYMETAQVDKRHLYGLPLINYKDDRRDHMFESESDEYTKLVLEKEYPELLAKAQQQKQVANAETPKIEGKEEKKKEK